MGDPTRFHGRAALEPVRLLRDVGQIAEALIAHLSRPDGSKVSITVEIQAEVADGFREDLRRTVSENARTLKFETSEFEPWAGRRSADAPACVALPLAGAAECSRACSTSGRAA